MFLKRFTAVALTAFAPALLAAEREGKEIPMPAGAQELEVPAKPTLKLGKKTRLLVGEKVIGERRYYNSGQLYEEKLLKDEVLHGLHRTWHQNGKPWQEHVYDDGVLHGICRSWDEHGKLLAAFQMRRGTGVLKTFHPNGRLATECSYKGGQRQGSFRQWHEDGALRDDTAYENGKEEGWSRFYHPDEQLLQEAMYRAGRLHGVMRIWNVTGDYIEDSPLYYIQGKRVTERQFEDAARTDRDLQRSKMVGR